MESINQRLRRLRKARGFTLKDIASKIGVPVSTYRDWEYGRAVQGKFYLGLASVFQVSIYELLTGERPEFGDALSHIEAAEENLRKARDALGPLLTGGIPPL